MVLNLGKGKMQSTFNNKTQTLKLIAGIKFYK